MNVYDQLYECERFQWDEGNRDKNWHKHRVTDAESEQVFFNEPLIAAKDVRHSRQGIRFYALGQTAGGRLLFVVFAVRQKMIRVISARDMTRREQRRYLHE